MKIIKLNDNEYPILLRDIKNAPRVLYIDGNINCAKLPCVTVIGSRNMSEYGKNMTRKIVKELVEAGVCIVSGLAVGIDSVAHQTCLENNGKTIAVLGSGLNRVFPVENIDLYKRIVNSGGCVMSEQLPDVEAKKMYFPARNRIVSGLSLGTLVIEATYRSGTSITAKFACEQGRKIFCIPNSVGSKNSTGIINLIKKGANIITNGKEILNILGLTEKSDSYDQLTIQNNINRIEMMEQEELNNLDDKAKKIYEHIKDNKVVNSEIMCEELNMNIQDINIYLSLLELKGLITNKSCGVYTISNKFDC